MKKIINKAIYILPLAFIYGCEPEFDDVEFNQGSADFTRTVAVGNSLTAGFQSSALRREKQEVSFPAMVAEQLKQVGGGDFKQPLMSPGVGVGSSLNAEFGLFLRPGCNGEVGPSPRPIAAQGQIGEITNPGNFIGGQGPFNNVGVPGAKSYHLLSNTYGDPAGVLNGTANPFFARFASASNETVLQAAMRNNPTFFMLWIGNNDVLGYSLSGGSGADQTGNPNPATYGSNDITDPGLFANVYTQLVNTLSANGSVKGVVANIPDVTSIPYFTTVPTGTDALTAAQASQLNAAYGAYNAGLDQAVAASGGAFTQAEADRRKITFTAGQFSHFVVKDPTLTNLPALNPAFAALKSIRQIKPGELLVLTTPTDSLTCFQLGTALPIQPQFHLTATEIGNISRATSAYNSTIRNLASANGLAFVDANATLKELATSGITVSGITFTDDFISGGAFSLDGVHPSTRGYAIIANEFIDAINSTYSANVPRVDVTSYSTIEVLP